MNPQRPWYSLIDLEDRSDRLVVKE